MANNAVRSVKGVLRGDQVVEYAPPGALPYDHHFDPPMPLGIKLVFFLIPLALIVVALIVGLMLGTKRPAAILVPVSLTASPTATVTATPSHTPTPGPTATGAPITATAGAPGALVVATSGYACFYTVAPGDTLNAVVYMMRVTHGVNMTIDQLMRLNNLTNPNLISVGQSLLICQ